MASALDAHTRVGEEVADVPGAVTMFGDDPQVVVDDAVHHWGASPLAAVAAGGLEEDERQREPEQQCCSGRGIGDVLLGAANKMPLALEVTVGEPAAGNEPSEHDERRRQDPAPGGCGVTGDHHDPARDEDHRLLPQSGDPRRAGPPCTAIGSPNQRERRLDGQRRGKRDPQRGGRVASCKDVAGPGHQPPGQQDQRDGGVESPIRSNHAPLPSCAPLAADRHPAMRCACVGASR